MSKSTPANKPQRVVGFTLVGDAIPENYDTMVIATSLVKELLATEDANMAGKLLCSALCDVMPTSAWNETEDSVARIRVVSRIVGTAFAALVRTQRVLEAAQRRSNRKYDAAPPSAETYEHELTPEIA